MKKLYYIFVCFTFLLLTSSMLFAQTLSVTRSQPVGETRYKSNYESISATFSEDMISLQTVRDISTNYYFKFNINIEGKYRWTSTKVLTFYPDKPLQNATEIVVTVPKGIKSEVTGNSLARDYTFSFNTIRPVVIKTSPYNNQSDISTKTDIVVYFNMPMITRDVQAAITLAENKKNIEFTVRNARTNDLRNWEIEDYSLNSVFVVTPKTAYKKDSIISLMVNQNLKAAVGNLSMLNNYEASFKTHKELDVISKMEQSVTASYSPQAPNIIFTTPVDYSELINNLEITPSVKLPSEEELEDYGWQSKNFSLYSIRFNPRTKYTIKIKKGLKDIFAQTLTKDYIMTLHVGDYNPNFTMPIGFGIVESYEKKSLPIDTINPNTVTMESRVLQYDEIIPFLILSDAVNASDAIQNSFYKKRYLTSYTSTNKFLPDVPINKYTMYPLKLDNYLGKNKYGFLSLKATTKIGYNSENTRRFNSYIQVTSMGITGKFSGDSNTILITDLKTGSPIENVDIEIRDDYNRVLQKAKTDKNGIAITKGYVSLGIKKQSKWERPRQWVIAIKGQDYAFINSDWGTGISPWRMNIDYNYYGEENKYTGAMFTERGIYKPGETVHIKGVIRDIKIGKWEVPKSLLNKEINYTIENSRGEEVASGATTINNFGSYLIDVKLKDDAPTGYYSVRASFKGEDYSIYQSFRVDVFKPLEFETRLWVEEKPYYIKDTMPIKMSGWYLFGEPMISNTVSYNVSIRETSYTPPNNTGFRFTTLSWYEDEYYSDYYSTIASGTGELNSKGEYEIKPKIETSRNLQAAYVNIEATVEGEDSQRVSSSKNVLVYGSDYYLGIKRAGYFIEQNKETQVEIIATDIEGKRLKGKDVEVTVTRRYWESVKRAVTGGRFEWETKQIDEELQKTKIKTTENPYVLKFIPKDAGLYFVNVKGTDAQKRPVSADEYMYVIGNGYVPWAMYDDDLLEMITEKDEYKPGETARIMVKSPFEEATAFVTVEREFVMDSFVTNIKGSAALIDVPIKNEYLPNVYVGVVLIKGRVEDKSYTNYGTDEGKPGFKIGYSSLSVSPNEKRLNVEIKKSHSEREPGEPLTVDLIVKDSGGKAVESEIMFSVVDIGVLNLIGYKTPNWFNTFYGNRVLNVLTSDSRLHLIGQRNYGEKGEIPGGDGEMANALRSMAKEASAMDEFSIRKNFLSTAYYNGQLKTDSNGKATVTFNLPDNLTSFRIMASAIDTNGNFGAADDIVTVKKNLMLLPTMPEFAMIEDKFMAGATLYNYSSEDLEVKVEAIVSNLTVEKSVQTVKIKKGQNADVRFNITANKLGEAQITLLASAKNYKDAVEKKLVVKMPITSESVAMFRSTDSNSVTVPIKFPSADEVYSDTGSLSLYAAPSAFSELTGGVEYLFAYPYMCLEQQVSKIYPVVLSKRLIIDMALTTQTEEALDNMVQGVLDNITSYQNADGSMSYWTSRSWSSSWLTSYVTGIMIKAKKEGYKVDNTVLNKALDYLSKYAVSRKSATPYYNDEYINLSSLATTAAILAEGGKSDKKLIDYLYQNINNIPFYGQTEVLRAMYYAKYEEAKIGTVRNYILNSLKEDANTAHYEVEEKYRNMYWLHSSAVRDTANALSALIETGYDNEINEKVVRYLTQARKNGRYLNTQDNVMAFAAMNMYFKKYEKVFPNFKTEFVLSGRELLAATFSARTDKSINKDIAIGDIIGKKTQDEKLVINRTGAGRLYYGVSMKYAPRELAINRDEGIKVERYFETTDGKKLDLKKDSFVQGNDYVVVVKITAPFERTFVAVDSAIPAGLKILNTSFETESDATRELTRGGTFGNWGSFNHKEYYFDKVLLFSDLMYKGVHTYRFVVRATTPGEYLLPATKAEEMYNPEVFGYDGQYKVKVISK